MIPMQLGPYATMSLDGKEQVYVMQAGNEQTCKQGLQARIQMEVGLSEWGLDTGG